MPMLIADHHLKNYDDWFEIFTNDPPPPLGQWCVLRGTDDPNRVYVIGEIEEPDIDAVKEWAASAQMQEAFDRVNAMSTAPMEIVWVDDAMSG